MKAHKLLYLLLVFVLFATCKKDRNRLFKTKVYGTVIDYFDLKPVEGVKVSVVYTSILKNTPGRITIRPLTNINTLV
ncbi:MAG: hypothetical protein BroJett020_20130 [Bacteroidota bacterium]|nr:MAG: hypothetical protein BroJett020_20130 [Bacteroidota bacterium]